MTKQVKTILAIAIIIIIAILAIAFWPKQDQPSNTNQPVITEPDDNQSATNPEPTATTTEPETITSDIDTSDWQTYRNEEYGFEVKYPRGWYVTKTEVDLIKSVFFHKEKTTEGALISVFVENIGDNDKDNIEVIKNFDMRSFERKSYEIKEVKVNDKINTKILLANQQILTLFRRGNYLYKVLFWPSGEIEESVYNAFLLSFKFTE